MGHADDDTLIAVVLVRTGRVERGIARLAVECCGEVFIPDLVPFSLFEDACWVLVFLWSWCCL